MHTGRTTAALVVAAALVAPAATAVTKPSPGPTKAAAAQKSSTAEAARQAAQLAAGEFVTLPISKRQKFPKWSGTTIDQRPWATSSLAGRVTVVNFWASWCVPCGEEWNDLQNAAAANPKVAFIGLNTMDKLDSAREFLKARPSNYLQVFDERGVMMASYTKIPHGVMPTTLILDKSGRIAAWRTGPLKQAQLQRGIKAVLG